MNDLDDFDEESIKQITHNLWRAMPNPDKIFQPPFPFGAKVQKRLKQTCKLVCFYNTVGKDYMLTALWYTVVNNFYYQWMALEGRKEAEAQTVPKVVKELSILYWSDAFNDHLSRCIGEWMVPLIYVVRKNVTPTVALGARMTDRPHAVGTEEEDGLIERDLISFAGHAHPLFKDNSTMVYFKLEEAMRGTQFAASLKPYQLKKDGCGTYLAILGQYTGKDKWEKELNRC